MKQATVKIQVRTDHRGTEKMRFELASAKAAVIDGSQLYFIFDDKRREVDQFEAFVMLCHELGVQIDWDATF